jgi:hypothetical protein
MTFALQLPYDRRLTFSTETKGLIIDGKEYVASADGVFIYDKTKGLSSNEVTCQCSTNTSTLIPALRILGVSYHSYFDDRSVIESQNGITFYWNPSKLAVFYNRYSTDDLPYEKRELVIRRAVKFLINSTKNTGDFLPDELLRRLKEPCKLLGFYEGFPIFDATRGMPKLLSRLGIHVGPEAVMVSTPMDRYAQDVEDVTRKLEHATGLSATRKKNRSVFPSTPTIHHRLNLF